MLNERRLIIIVFALLVFQICLFLENEANSIFSSSTQVNDRKYNMKVDIRVHDVDHKSSRSSVEIFVTLGPLPSQLNNTEIQVQVLGGGDMMIVCEYDTSDSLGKYFKGNCSSPWYFVGYGEMFPFDYYSMNITLDPFIDANFTISDAIAIFEGPKQRSLMDTWETARPRSNDIPYHISEGDKTTLALTLKRKCFVPFLAFVLPVVLCYYLLGASLFMDPTSRMQEILTLYLSLFVFVPTFFFAIQHFQPYRSILSIPEILLTNLITSLGLLGISTMMSQHRKEIKIKRYKIPLEWFSLISALLFFIVFYGLLFLDISIRSVSIEAVITFLLVVSGYIVGVIGFTLRLKTRMNQEMEDDQAIMCYCT